jgi:hypothetical protein
MKISQEVRDYAAAHQLVSLDDAMAVGMEEMAEEYHQQGRKLYHKV